MKSFLLSVVLIATVLVTAAQSPTTSTNVSTCQVFRNFNNSDEGFSSPSIYSSDQDASFFWNPAAGAEIENSGLAIRSSSLISPIYINSAENTTTVGFRYEAPAGTEYRIRVISAVTNPPLEILATTANGPVYTTLPSTSGYICVRLDDLDLDAGEEVRFEFTFRASNFGNILFDDLSLTVVGGPLPVTFLGFVARRNADNSTKLLWNVANEVNVKGYYVETSTDGLNFTSAGYVAATGSRTYNMTYPEIITQTRFFRIKNVDIDNRFKYSGIIRVNGQGIEMSGIKVYPNPARDIIHVQHSTNIDKALITVVNVEGRIMQHIQAMPNTYQTQVNVAQLTPGIYMIRFDDGKGNISTSKISKN